MLSRDENERTYSAGARVESEQFRKEQLVFEPKIRRKQKSSIAIVQ